MDQFDFQMLSEVRQAIQDLTAALQPRERKWEHYRLHWKQVDKMETLGEQGWELVCFADPNYIFKREAR